MDKKEFEQLTTFFYQSSEPGKIPAALEFFVNSEFLADYGRTTTGGGSHRAELFKYFFAKVAALHPSVLCGYEALCTRPDISLTARRFIQGLLTRIAEPRSPSSSALERPIQSGSDLDFLWYEFIVTGNKDAVRRIISVLDWPDRIRDKLRSWLGRWNLLSLFSHREHKVNQLRDIVGIVCDWHRHEIWTDEDLDCLSLMEGMQLSGPERWKAVREALPFPLSQADFAHIGAKACAKWSLTSNTLRHEVVFQVCREELENRRVQRGMGRTIRILEEVITRAWMLLSPEKWPQITEMHKPAAVSVQPFALGWRPGQRLLGQFEVMAKLGQGGMGEVYLVRSESTNQRFAVKKTRFPDDTSRSNFLTELQNWINLPEHPNLTACRFFRTVEDEIVIFAEYVEGGSLGEWIRERRVADLERILDVAIQFARGLDAAHGRGLIHQDVKPSNVLMTAEGLAKVSDFGLARARVVAGEKVTSEHQSILVSVGGMTPAYCSPEQAARKHIGRATDIWSWGVSILEMMIGNVIWKNGVEAPHVLETYLRKGHPGSSLPGMPGRFAAVLEKCFCLEPADRWDTMAQVADALVEVYRLEIGREYARQDWLGPSRFVQGPCLNDRRTYRGVGGWPDPETGLRTALEADGRDPAEADALVGQKAVSRRAAAVADLIAFQEIRRIWEKLAARGREDTEGPLSATCVFEAVIHEQLDDIPGALELYDRAIEVWTPLLTQERGGDAAYGQAGAYRDKAAALRHLGYIRPAVLSLQQAAELYRRIIPLEEQERASLEGELALVYGDTGDCMHVLDDNRAAVCLYERAIGIAERLVNKEGRRECEAGLGIYYLGKAKAQGALGDHRAAAILCDRAIALLERAVNQRGLRGSAMGLAGAYANKGDCMFALGNNRAAVSLYDKALVVYEPLVNQEERRELAHPLARVYLMQFCALGALGDNHRAVAQLDRAIAVLEQLVHQEGRVELAADLSIAYKAKAEAISALGGNPGAGACNPTPVKGDLPAGSPHVFRGTGDRDVETISNGHDLQNDR
jgi:serine/threonine protein kinase